MGCLAGLSRSPQFQDKKIMQVSQRTSSGRTLITDLFYNAPCHPLTYLSQTIERRNKLLCNHHILIMYVCLFRALFKFFRYNFQVCFKIAKDFYTLRVQVIVHRNSLNKKYMMLPKKLFKWEIRVFMQNP